MLRILGDPCKRYLMGSERPFGRQAVDLARPGPALGGAKHDHRPARTVKRAGPGARLDPRYLIKGPVERGGKRPMDGGRLVAFDEHGRVAVALEQRPELVVWDPCKQGRVRDLVAVEVQDGEHGAVTRRIQELVRVPAGGERAGLGLPVANDAEGHEVGIVEDCAVRVHECVAELTALVNRPRCLRGDVRRDAAGKGELPEQPAQPLLVLADVRVDLRVRALQVGVRHQPGTAVARPGDEDRAQVPLRIARFMWTYSRLRPGVVPQ